MHALVHQSKNLFEVSFHKDIVSAAQHVQSSGDITVKVEPELRHQPSEEIVAKCRELIEEESCTRLGAMLAKASA